jgi:hypothetical protein
LMRGALKRRQKVKRSFSGLVFNYAQIFTITIIFRHYARF